MKNKLLYVFFTVITLIFCFTFWASAEIEINKENIDTIPKVESLLNCVTLGDIDGNGAIKSDDARFILRLTVGLEEADEATRKKADVDRDGNVSSADARLALRYSVGLEDMPTHTLMEIVITPVSCGQDGITVKYCTSCNRIYAKIIIDSSEMEHKESEWITLKMPDCVHKGLAQRKCVVCGTITNEIELAATKTHTFEYSYPNGKSCVTQVLKRMSCTICPYTVDVVDPARKDHTFEWVETTPATCEEAGLKTQICTFCEMVNDTQEIPALGHNFVTDIEITPATCEETGLNAKQCSRCDETGLEYATEALGHDYDNLHYTVTKEPSCSEKGTADVICSICDHAQEIEIDVLPHTTDEWEITLEPTCTENGLRTSTCEFCGTVTEEIPANGHAVTSWVNIRPATCYEAGLLQGKCGVCGDTAATKETEMLPHQFDTSVPPTIDSGIRCKENATGHYNCKNCSAVQKVILLQVPCTNELYGKTRVLQPASCTSKQISAKICDYCDQPIYGTEFATGNALGHEYPETGWHIENPADCTSNGEKWCKCSRCDMIITAEIPATNHPNGEWITTKEPSCTQDGNKILYCTDCGIVLNTQRIPAVHNRETILAASNAATYDNGNFKVMRRTQCRDCGEIISQYSATNKLDVDSVYKDIEIVISDASDLSNGGTVYFSIRRLTEEATIKLMCGELEICEIIKEDDSAYYSFTVPEFLTTLDRITIAIE